MVQGVNARCHLPRSVLLSKPHTCEPGKKDAANSQDLGIVLCVAVLPVSAGSFEEGFPMPFNMQLLQGVYHLRRVLLCPEDHPLRHQFSVSSLCI